jgi:hypothetical protein
MSAQDSSHVRRRTPAVDARKVRPRAASDAPLPPPPPPFARPRVLFLHVLSPAGVAASALLLLGTCVFSVAEGLSAVDAAYVSTGIMTTVGLVIVPRTAAGRAFAAVFNVASLGVCALALAELAAARRASARAALRALAPPRWLAAADDAAPWLLADAALYAGVALPTLAAAALAFRLLEGWPLAEAAYFCVLVATGLGMGDVEPRHPAARLVFIVYVIVNTGAALGVLAALGAAAHTHAEAALLAWAPGLCAVEDAQGEATAKAAAGDGGEDAGAAAADASAGADDAALVRVFSPGSAAAGAAAAGAAGDASADAAAAADGDGDRAALLPAAAALGVPGRLHFSFAVP